MGGGMMEVALVPVFQLVYFVVHFLYSLALNVVSTWHLLAALWHPTLERFPRGGLYKLTSECHTGKPGGVPPDGEVPGAVQVPWGSSVRSAVRWFIRCIAPSADNFSQADRGCEGAAGEVTSGASASDPTDTAADGAVPGPLRHPWRSSVWSFIRRLAQCVSLSADDSSRADRSLESASERMTSGAGASDPRATLADGEVPPPLPQPWALVVCSYIRQSIHHITASNLNSLMSLRSRWAGTTSKPSAGAYTKGLAKTPRHLGMVLGRPGPSVALVASLVAQAASYGVKYVSLYDAFGDFVTRKDEVLEELRRAQGNTFCFRESPVERGSGARRGELERAEVQCGGNFSPGNSAAVDSTGNSGGSAKSTEIFGSGEGAPEIRRNVSGESEGSPENCKNLPEKSESPPENRESSENSPDKTESTEKCENSPEKSENSPEKSESSPEKSVQCVKSENPSENSADPKKSPEKHQQPPEESDRYAEKSPEKPENSVASENAPENCCSLPLVQIQFLGVQDGRQRIASVAQKFARAHAKDFYPRTETSLNFLDSDILEGSGRKISAPGLRRRCSGTLATPLVKSSRWIPEDSTDPSRITLDSCKLTLDPHRPTLDYSRPTLDHSRPTLDHSRPTLHHSRPTLDPSRPTPDRCKASLDPDRITLDAYKLTLDRCQISPDQDRITLAASEISLAIPELSAILSPDIPDPEVLISLGSKSTLGYPPWGLRTTEIHFLGLSEAYQGLSRVMEAYAGCQQRWGR